MSCGCVTPTEFPDLATIVDAAIPIVYTGLNHVTDTDGILTRSGGTPNTSDAYAYSDHFVDGESCAYWECRQFFDDATGNDAIFMVIEDEFGGVNKYGWHFQNGIADFRRSPYHGTTDDFPIYYGPSGGPAPPDQVGYNVGFRFGIYYNNGTVTLYENVQFTNDTDDFIEPNSYAYSGLPTDRRWRLRVYVFPSSPAHSPEIVESIGIVGDVCGTANWVLPPLGWSATNETSPHIATTVKFGTGNGSQWYYIPQLSDSGVELRTKTIKAASVIGKVTNANLRIYPFDVTQQIDISAMEAGTRTKGATQALSLPDTTQVAQSARKQVNVVNASMHTIRIEGDDRGETTRDRLDQISYEQAVQGVRR